MFLSWQTYEGIKVTVNSAIKATKFLLQEGTEFVLTERFSQDPLGININSEGALTIPTSMCLDTMPTPSEFRGQFPVKVETREAGKTNVEHGSRFLMKYCHVGRN